MAHGLLGELPVIFWTRRMALRTLKMKSCAFIWALLFSSVIFDSNVLHALGVENERWSLNFDNVVVSDALRELAKVTGVKIIIPSRLDNKLFTRSYVNQTIEEILKDMFRNMNYASLWYYSENRLDTIDIWIFDGGLRGLDNSSGVGRTKDEEQSVGRDFGANRSFNRGRMKGANPSKRRLAPGNRESGTSELEMETTENESDAGADDTQLEAKDSRQSMNDEAASFGRDAEEESAADETGGDESSPTNLQDEEPQSSLPSG